MKKKETQWFSHESTTHTSAQMLAMMEKYKATGYGCWWILVELLRQQDDYRYDISKKYSLNTLTRAMQISKARVEEFLADCINEYDLLQSDGEYIWCDALIERMQHLEEKKAILRERGRKGGIAKGINYANKEEDTYSIENNTCAIPLVQQNIAQTVHNRTEQKNSDDEEDRNKRTEINNNSSATTFFSSSKEDTAPVNTLSQQLLGDEVGFVAPLCTQFKFSSQRLGEWLAAFNQKLMLEGVNQKAMTDYRKHFLSWLKYQDVWSQPPKAIKNVVPEPIRQPTAEDILAERAKEKEYYKALNKIPKVRDTQNNPAPNG